MAASLEIDSNEKYYGLVLDDDQDLARAVETIYQGKDSILDQEGKLLSKAHFDLRSQGNNTYRYIRSHARSFRDRSGLAVALADEKYILYLRDSGKQAELSGRLRKPLALQFAKLRVSLEGCEGDLEALLRELPTSGRHKKKLFSFLDTRRAAFQEGGKLKQEEFSFPCVFRESAYSVSARLSPKALTFRVTLPGASWEKPVLDETQKEQVKQARDYLANCVRFALYTDGQDQDSM